MVHRAARRLSLRWLTACPNRIRSREEGRLPLDVQRQGFHGLALGNGSALPDKLPDVAKIEDGVIKITGKPPHLGSQWDYEDFDVRFEWRAMQEKYNSGFYIRSGRSVGATRSISPRAARAVGFPVAAASN